ncbi:MAG: diacylglycerol kinase [Methyloprofundus sp.]|nr:diacylglycerol kinase [Methyloprofundus sp.]
MAGFKSVWKHEKSFRQESVLLLVTSPLALWITDNNTERFLLIGSV